MGNKHGFTSFTDGSVLITLPSQHYMAGETVQGTISYVLDKPFPADKIYLELTGKECCLWDGSDDRSQSSKHPGKICMKSIMFKVEQLIHTFEGNVGGHAPVGKQKFPFSIKLPENMMPSFLFVGAKESQLRMVYKLKVRMGGSSPLTKD